jgi:two-component system sensor histidine kinase YesM
MVGINNTVKRIKLHFGAQYGVEISSEKDVGTKVVLILPSIKAEGQAAKGDGAY